jgi:hypothetical protein
MAPPRCGSKHFACPCARRVLGERPAQKDCRFLLRVRCPPTAFPAAPSPRTETSARPVSKSSSKEDYTIQRPSKRPHIGRGAAQTIRPKPVTPMSESGQSLQKCVARVTSAFALKGTERRTAACLNSLHTLIFAPAATGTLPLKPSPVPLVPYQNAISSSCG